MQAPLFPKDEVKRIAALYAARILDTPEEEAFDRITRLVARSLNVPIALISLVDQDRQWFKSKVGVEISETPRAISFCGHALLSSQPFVIPDAFIDDRFADNPLVTEAPHLRAYAGVPLRSTSGHVLGTLCSIDHMPRQFTADQLETLSDLAKTAEELLQQRENATVTNNLLQSLQDSEQRYRHLIEQSPDAFLIHSEGIINFVNSAGIRLLGAEHPHQLVGKAIKPIISAEQLNISFQRTKQAVMEGLNAPSIEQEWLRLDGTQINVEVTSIPFTLDNKKAVQVIARDITELKREKRELEKLATIDMLTGLPNRALFMDRLRQGISRWERQQQGAVIAFFDLDHFKRINDLFGHSIGDQALVAIAKNLVTWLRHSDTGARIGGDEFVLILEDVQDRDVPMRILQRVFDHISQPIWVGTHEIVIASSVGFSRYPEDGTTADALLNAADAAMYRAKELGRANIQQFTHDMHCHLSERLFLENQLRHAVERNELVLHYQPKVDLITRKIIGVEALIRWHHPELGLISPAKFIPIAEASGLIVPIGEWIIRTACEQQKAWQDAQIKDVAIAINLSSRQFLQENIVACVAQAIAETEIDPGLLEFELTESMSMGNPEKSIAIMRGFKSLGVSLSIDDFGTGYSNLSHLKRFPIDKLKIDRSFVSDMTSSTEALAIVQAIIAMSRSLHLTIIAEGVETEEQLKLLVHNQCDQMQGFYFCKPLPAVACTDFLLTVPQLNYSLTVN